MIACENEWLYAEFDPRGAAVARLVFKPLNRDVLRQCPDRQILHHYTNTIVGPIANRIKNAQFQIDDEHFYLDPNEPPNTLHGDRLGLSELEWAIEKANDSVTFSLHLEDAHMGFPGPSDFSVRYALDGQSLLVHISAHSIRINAFNLAPHFWFNLGDTDMINDHKMQIYAPNYLPINSEKIPTGEIASVQNTPFNFLEMCRIGKSEIDHNFCLASEPIALRLECDDLAMEIKTNQLGMQIYTGDHINREHIAIEPQSWPNAVNELNFPSQLVSPKKLYRSKNQFIFYHV